MLDEGNTVPFITRYRKDHTGGLDEEQIREIHSRIAKARQLAERKATILKTIEAQGKLTPELAEQIEHANTPKRLEDLYLPFKPKKPTLATIARERGLEPLAVEIFEAEESAADMQARAATYHLGRQGAAHGRGRAVGRRPPDRRADQRERRASRPPAADLSAVGQDRLHEGGDAAASSGAPRRVE